MDTADLFSYRFKPFNEAHNTCSKAHTDIVFCLSNHRILSPQGTGEGSVGVLRMVNLDKWPRSSTSTGAVTQTD